MKSRSSISRLRRVERKRAVRTVLWGLILIAALLGLVVKFGIPLLIQLAVLLTKDDSLSPEVDGSQILSAPTLDALPEATPTARIHVTGYALANTTVTILVNGQPQIEALVSPGGKFDLPIELSGGINSIAAQAKNSLGAESLLSSSWKIVRDSQPPLLSITSPADNSSTQGNPQKIIEISGQTDPEAVVLINGRLAIVSTNGKFSFRLDQKDGDNPLIIIARDRAGNEIRQTMTLTWHP